MGIRPLATVGILLAVLGQPRVAPAQAQYDPPDNETRVKGNAEVLVIRTYSAQPLGWRTARIPLWR